MAPTVCLAEFPTAGSTVNEYIRRRSQRSQNSANNKRRTSTERTLRSRTISETSVTSRDNFPRRKSECASTSEYSLLDKSRKISTNVDESCRRFVMARRGMESRNCDLLLLEFLRDPFDNQRNITDRVTNFACSWFIHEANDFTSSAEICYRVSRDDEVLS